MNIIQIANSIDRKNPSLKVTIDWHVLYELIGNLNYPWPDDKNTRLNCYWFECWYCTDSFVGRRAYFLDDELICVSYQQGRKCSQELQFVSRETYKKFKGYLESLADVEEDRINIIIPETAELPDLYTVEYSSQLMGQFHKFGYLGDTGEEVELMGEGDDKFHKVKVKYSDGRIEQVDCRKIEFEYGKTFDNPFLIKGLK